MRLLLLAAFLLVSSGASPVLAASDRVDDMRKEQHEASQRMRRSMDHSLRSQRKAAEIEKNRLEAQEKAKAVAERQKAKLKEMEKAQKGEEPADPYAESDLVKQLEQGGSGTKPVNPQ